MNPTYLLIILIGTLLLYVLYLKFQLAVLSRTRVVVMPQTTRENSGCGTTALAAIYIIVAAVTLFVIL
jgi:hypothetical protein